MTDDALPHWLTWAREIQAISQIGLSYSQTRFDTERYTRLSALAAEIIESQTGLTAGPTLENFLVQPGYATPKVDVRGRGDPRRMHPVGAGAGRRPVVHARRLG